MEARLEVAVRASVAWYEDVFAVHGVPTRVEDGLWSALGDPPRCHSAAKTLRPDVPVDQVVRAVDAFDQCAVADSYGTLDLTGAGFQRLLEATWLFRPASSDPAPGWPAGWSVVSQESVLAAWNVAHDTTGVLVQGLLRHPRFTVLAQQSGGQVRAGAVLHRVGDTVEVSNLWATGDQADGVASAVACADAVFPHRVLVGYSRDAELQCLIGLGFQPVGPHVVWVRGR